MPRHGARLQRAPSKPYGSGQCGQSFDHMRMCVCHRPAWRGRRARAQGHATDTYDEFVAQNTEKLRALPPPRVALEYYMSGDLYLFDELQTTGTDPRRRPTCECAFASLAACARQAAPGSLVFIFCSLLSHLFRTAALEAALVLVLASLPFGPPADIAGHVSARVQTACWAPTLERSLPCTPEGTGRRGRAQQPVRRLPQYRGRRARARQDHDRLPRLLYRGRPRAQEADEQGADAAARRWGRLQLDAQPGRGQGAVQRQVGAAGWLAPVATVGRSSVSAAAVARCDGR